MCDTNRIRNEGIKKRRICQSFLRQFFICTGTWNCYFMMGLSIGTPTVMVPQLRAANITVTEEAASWLPATYSYAGIPWIIILAMLTNAIGRKKTYIILSISCLIGYTLLYISISLTHIYISYIFQGACVASFLTISILVITEYTSPENRGIFLTLKSATNYWGILLANTIGTFFNWKIIAVVGIICSLYNFVSIMFWPESPYWLAGKGKFKECSAAHIWLKGKGEKSLIELDGLVKSYENKRFVERSNINTVMKTIFNRASLKPILLSSLLVCLYVFSGKLICTVYAIDILKKITKDNWTAYTGMLILDSVTVASMYMGCFVSRLLKRRAMLLCFSSAGIMFLYILSGYLYLTKIEIIRESNYVSISLLAAYSISISCGPMILSTSIIGELLPFESKCLFMCLNAFIFKFISSTFLKVSPYLFERLQMHGTFLLYSILSSIILVLIYFYVPETKNKTLQEIDSSVKGKYEEKRELMPVIKQST